MKPGYSSAVINNRMHKFLLVIVTLALVISPLRGALALPVISPADGADHCAQMQDGMHSMAGMQDPAADNPGHACDQGCGGDCCDGACNACVHGPIAVSSNVPVTSAAHKDLLVVNISRGFSGRTVHPPFRPPIFLLS